jgi:hypothetical protein
VFSTTVATQASATGAAHASSGKAASGGVLGATATKSSPRGGVLGALASVGRGSLPFTGFPLWIAALIGAAMVGLGLTLVRHGRATV